MRIKKRFIGYILMLLGISIPLYFVTTMVVKEEININKVANYSDFLEKDSFNIKNMLSTYGRINETKNIEDPFGKNGDEYESNSVGYLFIPSIAVLQPVYLGASEKNLEKGVVHLEGTTMLGEQYGRSVIAGHRSRINNLMFFRLNEVKEDDKVFLYFLNNIFEYQVSDVRIIKDTDWRELKVFDNNSAMLTLLTCDPVYPPFNYRLIVNSKLVSEEKTIKKLNKGEIRKNSISIYSICATLWLIFIFTLIYIIKQNKRT